MSGCSFVSESCLPELYWKERLLSGSLSGTQFVIVLSNKVLSLSVECRCVDAAAALSGGSTCGATATPHQCTASARLSLC